MFDKNEKQSTGRRPDFTAREGVSVWTNQDKNGNPYLSIHIPLLNIRVNCFKTKESEGDTNDSAKTA